MSTALPILCHPDAARRFPTVASRGTAASPGPALPVVVVDRPEDLVAHVPAWERLAAAALEPNGCDERWLLLPALRAWRVKKFFGLSRKNQVGMY